MVRSVGIKKHAIGVILRHGNMISDALNKLVMRCDPRI